MTDKNKEIFQQAVDQINVPKNEIQSAINRGLQIEQPRKKRRVGIWLEVGVALAAAASVLIMLRFTFLKTEEGQITEPSAPMMSSKGEESSINRSVLSEYNWRTADGTFYSFSVGEVQIRPLNEEASFYGYTIADDTLRLFDESEAVVFSYRAEKKAEKLVLIPLEHSGETIVLKPIADKEYTESDIAGLESAADVDLTAHEWIQEGDSNGYFTIITFDGAFMRSFSGEDGSEFLTGTYSIAGNEFQLKYDAMGGLYSSFYLYRDGKTLVFWPSDSNDHKEERQLILHPKN